MTDQTKIEWTDFTVNFREGCQKVGLGCDNCDAEARDMRFTMVRIGGQAHHGDLSKVALPSYARSTAMR